MKYLINLSINVNSALSLCNLRGEGRWEYNTLNALLSNNRSVHTTRNVWLSQEECLPSNLYDGLNEEWLAESVLLVHSAGRSLYIERDDVRAYVTQFHEPPCGQALEDIRRYRSQDRIVATVASWSPFIYQRVVKPFGKENVYQVAGAMVPYTVDDADNFRKPNVTWAYRNFRNIIEEHPEDISRLFNFLSPYLVAEPEMRVVIIVGLWDSLRFGTSPKQDDIRQWVLGFPVMQGFKHLFDRIDVYVDLHWNEVLSLLKETRWVISPAGPLGCPPYEAAMFGVPTIVHNGINPFMTLSGGKLFPELLTVPDAERVSSEFISLLNKLQNDHAFYRKTGDAYRKYTKENATFGAYVNQLDSIIEERGWFK